MKLHGYASKRRSNRAKFTSHSEDYAQDHASVSQHPGDTSLTAQIAHLQRTIGNQATLRLLNNSPHPVEQRTTTKPAIQRQLDWTSEKLEEETSNTGGTMGTYSKILGELRRYESAMKYDEPDRPDVTKILLDIELWCEKHIEWYPQSGQTRAIKAVLADVRQELSSDRNSFLHKLKRTSVGHVYGEPPAREENVRQIIDDIRKSAMTEESLTTILGRHGQFTQKNIDNNDEDRPAFIEWGIGKSKTSNEYVLIAGKNKGVDWGPFLKFIDPVAHSHPYFNRRQMSRNANKGYKLLDVLFDPKAFYFQKQMVLPTGSDIMLPSDQGMKAHTVYTPYLCIRKDGDWMVYNPTKDDEPIPNSSGRLTFQFENIQKLEKTSEYHCMVIIRAGTHILYTFKAKTNDDLLKEPIIIES
jgi:hypothetical protein